MDAYEHVPTEEEWAVIGRYLAGRMRRVSGWSDGVSVYEFSDGWPQLVGRSVPQAVKRAIVLEDEERKKMEGGK